MAVNRTSRRVCKTKKAQGLSLNVVIIAAIAIIVLVVLIYIFSSRIRGFADQTDSSTAQVEERFCWKSGGTCATRDASGDVVCADGKNPDTSKNWIDCAIGCCK